jgi:hypothetical protein
MQCAFQDRQRSESVNILSGESIAVSTAQVFDFVLSELTDYEQGEVLSDSRGTGSLQ